MKRTLILLVVMLCAVVLAAQQPLAPARPLTSSRTPVTPSQRAADHFPPLNFKQAAELEKTHPPARKDDVEAVDTPGDRPDIPNKSRNVPPHLAATPKATTNSTPSFGTGISPAPVRTFKGEFLSGTTIPPDTMGAVGTTHIVTVSNDRMRILTRDGVELSRLTLTSFWAGVTIKGAAISAFDPKVYFDRFNGRFILISSGNGQNVNSGAMFAVSQTSDPTGTWNRWSVAADPSSTAAGGHWIDYPTAGHNKNWIVIHENVFNFGTAGTGFWGDQIYVLDKQAAYANTLGTINLFQGDFNAVCLASATPETELSCGFTMAPAITEDNTTDTEYLVEDWDSTAAQLRLSKIEGTPSAPVLTVGTQFPQSSEAWRFNALRLGTANNCGGTCSGGYVPQRQQSANLTSGTRIMTNDSRVQNAVLRNGKLWCAHTVMLAASSQPAGTTIGGTGNPIDNHSGIQWWQIDPTNETGGSVPPLQRGRIHDPTANNCHNGNGGTTAVAPCNGTTAIQFGEFFAFPNISVNQNEDVFIGFSRFSPLTYPNSGYVIRRSGDSANTTRDPVIFRAGQSNYNIGSGSGTARQNRWGDYSSAQTDPLDDTRFWAVQEYAGTNRNDFLAPSYAGPWETWWTQVDPATPAPTAGGLIISEFRLRGPQGVRDEFVELYNPNATPVIVGTTDGSDGWALVNSNNGTTVSNVFAVVPNGTVVAPGGHFLVTDNPDNTAGGTSALTYSLNAAASTAVRGADSDTGWSLDLADNGGIALFNTSTTANFSAGTRLDSAGFSTIAAGLFKEGNGIPAVTAATPTGQITFYRDLSSGTPKDTGANENDFIFANTVVGETLGSTPRLGAAGPENLSSPLHATGSTTLPAALVDTGAGLGDAPNRFRDITPVTNGASGTLSFRRTFTNNTGADLPRLRFRIVDITTNPPTVNHADLRALTSSNTSVSLSGGGTANISGTTVETPPTQAAGGALNTTFNVPAIALATPLTAGSSINLQFALGVQTGGIYNFCLVAEGLPATAQSAPLCFAGTTDNLNPQITGGTLSLAAGASVTGTTIATVTDDSDPAGSLAVVATSVPSGITLTNLTNAGGAGTANITADVAADCSLTTGPYLVTLKVTDSEQATNTSTFTINVTATPAPSTPTISADTNGTGTQDQACPEVPLTLHANGATGATSYQWYKDIDLLPGETNSTYQATGAATYYVTASNACGTSSQSAGYVVQNPTPHSPFISFRGQDSSVTTLAICQGSSQIIDSDSATGIHWWKDGVDLGPGSQSLTVTTAGVYTAQLNALGCHSQFGRNVTVTVDAMPPTPTISGDTNGTGTQDQACPEQPLTLHANGATGATSYTWYTDNAVVPNENTSTLVVTYVANISVTATNGTCTTPHSATYVVQNPTPHSPFISFRGQASSVTSLSICQGQSQIIDSDSATGIHWWKDGVDLGPGSQSLTVTTAGVYTAQLNALGCHSQFGRDVTVTVNPIPSAPTVTPGGPTTFCAGGSVTLTSSSASGNQWLLNGSPIGGATNQTYNATASGNYTATVTSLGCTSPASNTVSVTVNPIPSAPSITGNSSFCAGGSTTLTSSSASGNQWYLNGNPIGGATNNTYVATAGGSYTVTVTVSGCTSAQSTAKVVTVNPNPDATITAPAAVPVASTGNVASVANAGAGATYNWGITNGTITGGTGTNSITFTAGGAGTLTLNVTVTTGAGCSDAKSANVTVTQMTVTNVTPANGPYFGGQPVTVTGTGFNTGATVTFGGAAATNVVVQSSTTIKCKTPAHAPGAVNVTVTNTNTTSATLNNAYTYRPQQFDPNGDNMVDPSDIFFLVNYLYLNGHPPIGAAGMMSGDANGDGIVDPADIFYAVNYLFGSGPQPAAQPGHVASTSAEQLNGALTLGQPRFNNGRFVIPVIVTMAGGSDAPQSIALRARIDGNATVRRAGAAEGLNALFETSKQSDEAISYLVSFDAKTPLVLGSDGSAVVAEIELAPRTRGAIELDPALSMIANGDGSVAATVRNGKLLLHGTTIGSNARTKGTNEE